MQTKKLELTEPKQTNIMKKLIIAVLLGGLVLQQTALSQTNADGTSQMAPTESATNTPATADAGMTNPSPAVAESNAPAMNAAGNETATATATNSPAATIAEQSESPATNAPAVPVASIPLIQFQDVPLTTAIENLARQAGINYLLDPKIGYGQPDQNGQIKAEPTLSIRWENVTAEQALLALLDNYNLQLIEDKNTHIARITTKDPSAPPTLVTRVIQLKYSSVSNMTVAVQSVFTDKRSKVLPDTRTSQLVVVATDSEQSAVDTLINQLDTPTRQVLIETHFVEITSSPQSSKGIDWSGTLSAQTVTFGNGILNGTTPSSTVTTAPGTPGTTATTPGGGYSTGTTPGYSSLTTLNTLPGSGLSWNTLSGLTPDIGFLNASGLSAVLAFLNSSADAQVISTPRIVTLDNETATLAVTRGYPVFNVQGGSVNNAGGSSIQYTNVGTTLEVTPRISANDYIWLKVVPEVSSFFGNFQQSVNFGGAGGAPLQSVVLSAPQFDVRTFQTQVLIPNGNTLVMGGLVNNNPKSQTTKVPVLGDIPILGYAFRSETKSTDRDNLIIFITPTIVKDTDFQPTATGFLKTRPDAKLPTLFNPKSAWDSTKPYYDWSSPSKKSSSADSITDTQP
jgi:type II secretory pathway component GspD/PulD (secretin)